MLLFVVLGGSVFAAVKNTNTNPIDYISSITLPNTVDSEINANEQEEAKQLSNLATVTQEEAKQFALAEINGIVKDIQLENEDGNVVYGVEIENAGTSVDIKIDAGNGKVLRVESDNEEESGDFETDGIEHQFEGDEADHED